jgi:hypothetical protein
VTTDYACGAGGGACLLVVLEVFLESRLPVSSVFCFHFLRLFFVLFFVFVFCRFL